MRFNSISFSFPSLRPGFSDILPVFLLGYLCLLLPFALCLSMSSLFIHAGLAFLPVFLFVGMHCPSAWRRWSLNISEFSWAFLPSRDLSHGYFTKQIPEEAELYSPEVWDLCFFLVPSWLEWYLDCCISSQAEVAWWWNVIYVHIISYKQHFYHSSHQYILLMLFWYFWLCTFLTFCINYFSRYCQSFEAVD